MTSSTEPTRLDFDILDLEGKEYHRWVSDLETTFVGKRLTNTIIPPEPGSLLPPPSLEAKAQALMYLRRHIHPSLKKHYLTLKDPKELWDTLKQRFNNIHDAQLPELTAKWESIRMMDYDKINSFNQAMLDLKSDLSFCGVIKTEQEMIEKALQTFPVNQSLLAHQYRIEYEQERIASFADLINSLSKKERYHELLLNTNNRRPAGTQAETHYVGGQAKRQKKAGNANRGGSAPRGRRGGRGRGRNMTWHRDQNASTSQNRQGSGQPSNNPGKHACFKCGSLKHLKQQCQASREIQNIYKRHRQYLAQESNFAGDFEEPEEVDAILVLTESSGAYLATPDFE